MQTPKNIAACLLLGESHALAETISQVLLKTESPGGTLHLNGHPHEFLFRIEKHLHVLAACIEFSSPRLLADYLIWSRRLDSSHSQKPDEIDLVFEQINQLCETDLPKQVGQLISKYFTAAYTGTLEGECSYSESPSNTKFQNIRDRYLASILNSDRNEALQVVMQSMQDGVAIESIYLEVLQASQHEIGTLWQRGKITVAQEHYCTAATQFVMAQLQPFFMKPKAVEKVLVACCVGSELHEIGLRIVTDLFEIGGWETIYIGANVPPESVVQSVVASQADVLAVSTTMTDHLFDLAETIAAVRASVDIQGTKIVVGGYPFNVDPFLWRRVQADAWAKDAKEALRLVNQFEGNPRRRKITQNAALDLKIDSNDQQQSRYQPTSVEDNLSLLNNELITAQRKLTKANIELKFLNEANEKKTAELADADRRKDQFLAMLAHELRGPLAPMNSAVEVLKRSDGDQQLVSEAHDVIRNQIRHMSRLISDLLDVSRITHGKIKLDWEVLQLSEIIARAVEIASPLLEQRKHKFEVDSWPNPIAIEGDAIRLTQVVANLITNAAKYTDPGGSVKLSTELRGDRAVIVVSDNGIGISPNLLTSMFTTFSQEERSRDYSQGGLGLGLSLVKQLAEMHGGNVVAHSSGIGCGSRFTVSIPALETTDKNGETEQSDVAVLAEESCEARRVLIVDDVAGLALITGRLFELLGHEAVLVENGKAALEVFNTFKPHIVVLDLHLEDMSGFEVAQHIRRTTNVAQPVLVALTGSSNLQFKAAEAGFDEYMVKPVDINELQRLFNHPKLIDAAS